MCFFYTKNQGGGRNDQSGKGSLESRVHHRRLPRDVFVENVREKAINEEQAHNEQAEVLNDFDDEIVPKNSHLMSRFLTVR